MRLFVTPSRAETNGHDEWKRLNVRNGTLAHQLRRQVDARLATRCSNDAFVYCNASPSSSHCQVKVQAVVDWPSASTGCHQHMRT